MAEDEATIHIVQNLTSFNQAVTALIPAKQRLSFREAQVLECIARGFTSKQIASTLGLSVFTVGNYRKQILKKLDLHATADLVAFWFRTYRFVVTVPEERKAVAAAT
ncbi:MAG: response regulator transcription factor [Acidobacteriota bacterium]|jgi:DNA-binding NarL/FixJ family response regulator